MSPKRNRLRLGDTASRQLGQADELEQFRAWLEDNRCYVFTVNGFPYGDFHGTRVKEDVYTPDWTTPERVEYTKRLFDILAALVPPRYRTIAWCTQRARA